MTYKTAGKTSNKLHSSKRFNNLISTPVGVQRVMRVITTDNEYYDIIIAGGTSPEQRMAIAKVAHVLSGYYQYGDNTEIEVKRIVIWNVNSQCELISSNGEAPCGEEPPLEDDDYFIVHIFKGDSLVPLYRIKRSKSDVDDYEQLSRDEIL